MKNVAITDYSFEDLSIEEEILERHGLNLISEKNPKKETTRYGWNRWEIEKKVVDNT